MLISTSFVTDIEVLGNEKLTKQQVIDMLSQTGFRKGMLIYNIDKKLIQQEMIKNFDEFSWIWIDLNGTRANVTIKERVPVPEISDNTDYSNCVASSDGVIVEVMPRYGKQIVFPGDVVKRGDLLISGISETKADDIRYLHADGIVMAKTWYSISGEYNHTRIDRHLTGE